MSFVHLHCHSEYSLLDGLSRIPQLVARAKALGQPAVALTDHGAMYGAVEFWQAATDAGIKPIVGMESYLARARMSDRLPGEENKPYHLLLLAKNAAGYQNLLKLASLAQLEGFYYKPRIDKDTLAAHSEGLICTTGCLAAEIPRLLTEDNQPEKARREIGWYYDVFGPENFFFELQDHSLNELRELNKALVSLAPTFNARFVATNDVHYVMPEEAAPHDVLLCIQTAKLVTDPNRMKMSDSSYYLKSRAEMEAMFGHIPGALDNTLLVAEMCDLDLKTKGYHLPQYSVPEGHTAASYLRQICEEGLRQRYGARADDPQVRQRLEYELGVITRMGFDAYFLIVWDLCQFARGRGIWWNVRGSGASSIVAYSSGITNLDPLRNSLIFERFLNPDRISMPDIDLDYPDDRRAEMIEYTVQKYGKDNVAQIITFGTLGARAAIRDIGRAMDIPLAEIDRIAKLVPSGPKVKLKDAFDNPEFNALYESQDYIRKLVDTAGQLEGVSRHASTHAAGVVISDRPLVEYLPLNRPTKGSDESGLGAVTQFPMEIIDKIGLLKVDFLGLATLTIMRRACDLIEQRHGRALDLTTIPYARRPDEPEADANVKPLFDLLSSGHVDGIFQVESEGMRKVLTSMRPSEFEHIIAVVALYRPGPMDYIPTFVRRMHGDEPEVYHHPVLEPILGETFGIIVYQEQIIQIATTMAGYTPGEADQIRKAVSKKIDQEIARHRQQFIDGSVRNGFSSEVAQAVYGDIEFFANYGFNKCLPASVEVMDAATGRLVTIGDLASGRRSIEHTLTCDTNRLRLRTGTVTHVHDNGVKPVFRLTTQLGRQIEATANHPFYTYDGWRELGQLKPGDQLAVPRHIPAPGRREWPEHEVIVLGHLLAEGNLCHPNGVYYYTTDEAQLADYTAHLECFDNTAASVSRPKQTYSVYSRRVDRARPATVFEWAAQLGILGKTAHSKEIPAEVFELAPRQLGLLLSRLWEGDGHLNEAGRSLYYATASERLARQLQHLLLRLGIISRLRRVVFPYKDGRTGFQLFITGYEDMRLFAEQVGVYFVSAQRRALLDRILAQRPTSHSTRDVVPLGVKQTVRQHKQASGLTWGQLRDQTGVAQREFSPVATATKSGFTRRVVGRLAEFFDADDLRTYAESDVYWDKVTAIEYVGEQPTYDLTVADTHNFVANDFIVHNSHAADYAMITCQTAYLKAHYPVEYMTALLSVWHHDTAKVALYCVDARRMGLQVLPPDINLSGMDFIIQDAGGGSTGPAEHAIRYGLAAIKNVGGGPVQILLDARAQGGPFTSLDDFCQRVDLRLVGKRALECLIKVGACDSLGPRGQLLDGLEQIVGASTSHFRAAEAGQLSLFGGMAGAAFSGVQLPKTASQITRREMLAWEKELIGLYVSDHPLQPVADELQAIVTHYSQQLTEDDSGRPVVMAGVVTNIRPHHTKKGDPMGFVSIEDLQGHLELVVFPRTWREVSPWLALEQIIVVHGKVDAQGSGSAKIIVDTLSRDFNLTRSREPARQQQPMPSAQPMPDDAPLDPTPSQSAPRPQASVTQPDWDDGPPPWLDDEMPPIPDDYMPTDDTPPPAPRQPAGGPGAGNSAAVRDGNGGHTKGNGGAGASPSGRPDGKSPSAYGGNGGAGGKPANGDGSMGRRLAAVREARSAAEASPPQAPRRVVVTIHSSGDMERDRRRLRRLHGLLTSYPGQDSFEFAVHDYNARSYHLRFPNETTGLTPALERQLQDLLGPGAVDIQPFHIT